MSKYFNEKPNVSNLVGILIAVMFIALVIRCQPETPELLQVKVITPVDLGMPHNFPIEGEQLDSLTVGWKILSLSNHHNTLNIALASFPDSIYQYSVIHQFNWRQPKFNEFSPVFVGEPEQFYIYKFESARKR